MAKLHSIVDLLKDELNALKKSTHNREQWPPLAPGTGQPTAKDSLPSTAPGEPTARSTTLFPHTAHSVSYASYNQESKYNLVLY